VQVDLLTLQNYVYEHAIQTLWKSPENAEMKKCMFLKIALIMKLVGPTAYPVFQSMPARSV